MQEARMRNENELSNTLRQIRDIHSELEVVKKNLVDANLEQIYLIQMLDG